MSAVGADRQLLLQNSNCTELHATKHSLFMISSYYRANTLAGGQQSVAGHQTYTFSLWSQVTHLIHAAVCVPDS